MDSNQFPVVFTRLSEKLAATDQRIGEYVGHASTGKGITLRTSRGSLFLYHSLIHKLLSHPEELNVPELEQLVGGLR